MFWIAVLTRKMLICFNEFIKTLNKYSDKISNYFIAKNNSSFAQEFNDKVKFKTQVLWVNH
jgi:hypothetical protein